MNGNNQQISGSCESVDASADDFEDGEDSDVDIESNCWKRVDRFRYISAICHVE